MGEESSSLDLTRKTERIQKKNISQASTTESCRRKWISHSLQSCYGLVNVFEVELTVPVLSFIGFGSLAHIARN